MSLRHGVAVCFISALFLASGVMGKDYVVDCGDPAASDAGDGEAGVPFKTISKAIGLAVAGDTVMVMPGVYRESVVFNNSGVEGKPIILKSKTRYGAVITGADIVTGWEKEGEKSAVWLKRGWALRLPDRAKQCGYPAGRGEQAFVDGMLLKQVRTRVEMKAGTFCLDEDNSIFYIWPMNWNGEGGQASDLKVPEFFGGDAVKLGDKAGSASWPFNITPIDIGKRVVEVSVRPNCLSTNKQSHVQVEGFVFRYGSCLPQNAIVTLKGEDIEMRHCVMEWAAAIGLSVRGSRINIRDCVMRFNGQMGLGGFDQDGIFENCALLYNNYKHSSFGFGEEGGCKWVRSDGLTVRNCFVAGNDGPGIWFDIDNRNCVIERNWAEGNSGPGIMYEISSDAVIRNNVCIDNGRGLVRDVVMSTSEPFEEVCAGQGILIQMSSNCQVYNNTCVNNRKAGVELRWHPYLGDKEKEKYHLWNNKVFNNLLVDNGRDNIIITEAPALEPTQVKGNICDYNLYHTTQSLLATFDGRLPSYARWGKNFISGNYSMEEWRAIKGFDAHSIQWDPFMLMPAQRDYRLSKLSPAIGAGSQIKELEDDFNGRPRPKDRPPCIGAFERSDEDEFSSQAPAQAFH